MNQGWECPKCGRVYAPFVQECKGCAPQIRALSTVTTTCTCGTITVCPIHRGGQVPMGTAGFPTFEGR